MEDNNQIEFTSEIHEGVSRTITWTLKTWKNCHKILAEEADCVLNIDNVKLRFFFRPFTKIFSGSDNPTTTIDFYALCVQVLSNHKKVSLKVKTKNHTNSEFSYSRKEWEKETYLIVKTSAENQDGVSIVDPEFFRNQGWYWDFHSSERRPQGDHDFVEDSDDLKISITSTLCHCIQEDNNSMCTPLEDNKTEMNPIITHLQRLLQNHPESLFADVSLKMQDNVTLQGHRLILASASSVFEAMLTSGLKETQTGVVEIPDVSSDVMKILLQYMYSGKVDSTTNVLTEQVIYAASKYQLGGLIEHFDNALIKICNPGNVIGLLQLAIKYNLRNASADLQKYTEIHAQEIIMHQIKQI